MPSPLIAACPEQYSVRVCPETSSAARRVYADAISHGYNGDNIVGVKQLYD
jgi:hypothetical protein